ncbi:methylthioribose-1-phosphate isomerase [Desulforamulus reducens MI-1]|uniref:Methylthioribose-1-phosphate isomerase n=1 Tax=Desulforamulus reducens (strain ATCC BAA-1160 / DSM 100696 / MI-1) TaxID=349161 RepID=MTNA_DESRM|nr:S-methyl-5-thioribose-1-phosphate isomerase [Desulforamulus reducens]A4J678.1 RecName: Full=Methylthioribose-1-phosphate isomerase; Short=M1Pi; Short=MTR-1-P isomerase; AltName: Full=S-methyl-5-thioribose-1-phosphate isomerase [Desulforamulus reducens MI-1]ABO50581.1 methylthioribose-1-phosphate isomerase [Desulforamulus reducens MI-1]
MNAIIWENNQLQLLDQTKLPRTIEYIQCTDYHTVGKAIKKLSVRGAPAIGAAAAYGLVVGAQQVDATDRKTFLEKLEAIAGELGATRPTAVNLRWALDRMMMRLSTAPEQNVEDLRKIMLEEAHAIYNEDVESNRKMGEYGQELLPEEARVLTHCNAGALATAGYGTALGVVRAAHEKGKKVHVYADETRPLLQGARLTSWEMVQEGIPVTLITDNMAGYLMSKKMVDCIVVGADRITANGDVANKIGTYGVAVLANHHNIPFYVAAPLSTIDMSLSSGEEIPIEERDPQEVTHHGGQPMAPEGVQVWNPAFDVTPNSLVKAIITERGVVLPPFAENLAKICCNKK